MKYSTRKNGFEAKRETQRRRQMRQMTGKHTVTAAGR